MSVPLVGLKFKEQLPYGPIRDEFEQLVAAIQAGFSQLESEIESGVTVVSNIIVSVQEVEITIATLVTTGTASLTIPIDTRYTEITLLGMRSNSASGAHGYAHAYVSAITETDITITRSAAGPGPTVTCRYQLTQYRASALRTTVQVGVIPMVAVATNTGTIQSVGPKRKLNCTGWSSTTVTQESDAEGTVEYTSATTLTAKRDSNNGTAHVGYCIVDFN